MKKTLMGVMLLSILAVACTKSSSSTSSGTILGKWNLSNVRTKTTVGTFLFADETQAQKPGQYLDFKENGTVYSKSYDSSLNIYTYDTGTYKYSGDTLIDYTNNQIYKVQTLTGNNLTLNYQSSDSLGFGLPVKIELWVNLIR